MSILESPRGETVAAEDPGAEHADVRELVEIGESDAERLIPSHGETGDGAAPSPRENAVLSLGQWHDVLQEVVDERIGGVRLEQSTGSRRVPSGHDDDHRLRASGGDEVVEDEVGAADVRPGRV